MYSTLLKSVINQSKKIVSSFLNNLSILNFTCQAHPKDITFIYKLIVIKIIIYINLMKH